MAWCIERVVLRPLVNQGIILFMATIGLAFFLEGFGQTIFGADPKTVPTDALGIPDGTPPDPRRRVREAGADLRAAI